MPANTITITDDTDLVYMVGFPIFEKDLGLWHNGNKLILNTEYTFDQNVNSVTLLVPVDIGDTLQFRMFADK